MRQFFSCVTIFKKSPFVGFCFTIDLMSMCFRASKEPKKTQLTLALHTPKKKGIIILTPFGLKGCNCHLIRVYQIYEIKFPKTAESNLTSICLCGSKIACEAYTSNFLIL